mmetsp:Transcript_16601/g.38339  ORF Transcript_16601/g.38339 Transcript_16601/m.38339 type:complete len:237 (+) Transcript_16601:61-771(+)
MRAPAHGTTDPDRFRNKKNPNGTEKGTTPADNTARARGENGVARKRASERRRDDTTRLRFFLSFPPPRCRRCFLFLLPLDVVEGDTEVVVVVTVVAHRHVDGGLVDSSVFGELPVLLEVAGLVGRVLVDDVDLLVLEVSLGDQDDVTRGDPDLLSHLPADVPQAGHTVEAEALAPTVPEHLDDLRVLLAVFLELELALGLLSVALSSSSVLSSLSLWFRHLFRSAVVAVAVVFGLG